MHAQVFGGERLDQDLGFGIKSPMIDQNLAKILLFVFSPDAVSGCQRGPIDQARLNSNRPEQNVLLRINRGHE